MIRGLAVCAGIGGLELSLELAFGDEYRTVGAVEREAFAAAVLVARMEDEALDSAPVWDEVESFDGRLWRGVVDCISAGFPCQPWSSAGKRKGIEDERWIWPDIARIIRQVEPWLVFVENVPGLRRVDRREVAKNPEHVAGLGYVLGDLARLGFDAEWLSLSASDVGATHQRERIFILAVSRRWAVQRERGPGELGTATPGGTGERSEREWVRDTTGNGGADLADAQGFSSSREQAAGPVGSRPLGLRSFPPPPDDLDGWARVLAVMPEVEPALCQLADGIPDRLDQLRALGNAVVPLQATAAFRELIHRSLR